MDRRQFLKKGLGFAAAVGSGLLLPTAMAEATQPVSFNPYAGSRTLNLVRPETKEKLQITYMRDGVWTPEAYPKLCWLLRDWQAGVHVQMDYTLIAILDWTQEYLGQFGYHDPIQILSGYRTPQTNAHTERAAQNSMHLYGKAVDIKIPGLSAEYLGKLYQWLGAGGVGVYVGHNFVHVDTGRVRRWRG